MKLRNIFTRKQATTVTAPTNKPTMHTYRVYLNNRDVEYVKACSETEAIAKALGPGRLYDSRKFSTTSKNDFEVPRRLGRNIYATRVN